MSLCQQPSSLPSPPHTNPHDANITNILSWENVVIWNYVCLNAKKGVAGGEGKVHKEGGGGHLGARKGLTPP